MKRLTLIALLVSVAAATMVSGQTPAPSKEKNMAGAKAATNEVVMMADAMQFKEVIPGVSRAVLWGDPDKGAYGAITKFAAGTKAPLHTHAHDIKIVVLSGAYIYETESGVQKIGPGSYILVPAGKQHKSGCDDATTFVEIGSGKFTLDEVAKRK